MGALLGAARCICVRFVGRVCKGWGRPFVFSRFLGGGLFSLAPTSPWVLRIAYAIVHTAIRHVIGIAA